MGRVKHPDALMALLRAAASDPVVTEHFDYRPCRKLKGLQTMDIIMNRLSDLRLLDQNMKKRIITSRVIIFTALIFLCLGAMATAQEKMKDQLLDQKVRAFLKRQEGKWVDMNVPASDGKALYDIIVKNKYTSALEIGTSTGHSAVWIAWALSKTGGRLITIEIDEERYNEALANFKEAGLADRIDARLADAHDLVKELKGPFDFVFCDADKQWYTNYFIDILPKLKVGGCYTAHNVSDRQWGRRGIGGTREFYDYVVSLPNMATSVDSSGAGLSISFKRSD